MTEPTNPRAPIDRFDGERLFELFVELACAGDVVVRRVPWHRLEESLQAALDRVMNPAIPRNDGVALRQVEFEGRTVTLASYTGEPDFHGEYLVDDGGVLLGRVED